jgi:hypothetical protein
MHVGVAAEHDVVEHAHALEQSEVLEGAGDAHAAMRCGATAGHVLAEQVHRAGVGGIETADDIDHRRLAGAVRADQTENLASVDMDIDALERLQAAEGSLDASAGQDLGALRMGGAGGGRFGHCALTS